MKKVVVILLTVAFLLVGAAAWAQRVTGQDLDNKWHDYQKKLAGQAYTTEVNTNAALYAGFVRGVVMTLVADRMISLPDGSTVEQWCAVVGNYLDAHPEDWTTIDFLVVVKAMVAVWPSGQSATQ